MKKQFSKTRSQKKLTTVPKTIRFCVLCEKNRTFKYNRKIFHSECMECGSRFSNKQKYKLY